MEFGILCGFRHPLSIWEYITLDKKGYLCISSPIYGSSSSVHGVLHISPK